MEELKLLLKNIANLVKIKSLITLLLISAMVHGFVVGTVPIEVFAGMAMAVITYYFTKAE